MMYFLWISLATTILEESISNTNTPTNNKKDTCSRQQLEGKKDRSCLSKETWKRSQIWMIKIGEYSNVDVEMEITPNISEDLSGYNKSSLRSWKRIMRNSNNQSSPDIQNNYVHLTKCPSVVPSPLQSPAHKKTSY